MGMGTAQTVEIDEQDVALAQETIPGDDSAVRALNSLARGTTRRNRALLERLTALETATAAVRELVVARMVNR